ncbi:Eukaryotic initiation factor 3 gamma subunit [Penicillium paradoxum]|uniref:Eukaryotic initiation factor 3 gamma subunit n=1 Tax=Penicillium paradoxum TaxID=176176 RepID=UPI0025487921|nr:Eukaryotic initiation factor 3 gamma subunit [Penicillium paradoxum]KAJ5795337.1 Eukaryotic initiation factor 3 gamma subunit [Penicillium paradoxum]
MHSYIRPGQFVAIRMQSDQLRLIQILPDTVVNLGRFGQFAANQIIGRPFYFTFEILDERDNSGHQLRVVSATELHAETLLADGEGDGEGDDVETGENGVPMRTNRQINDENSSQKLTLEEIEELKREAGGAGREIVAKLLESHSAIDQKTAFSLAKYTLRKRKKYLKRFTVLPLDVGLLANYLIEERDAQKAMELRDEHIGLIGCWGNVHHSGNLEVDPGVKPHGRYVVVDETGGLVVAAMAERMGILYPHDANEDLEDSREEQNTSAENVAEPPVVTGSSKARRVRPQPMSATTNTITVVHAYAQPNLSLLKYFGYDTNNPDESHPLHTHLKTVSWMQLADPNADPLYANEPPAIPAEELAELKQSKRTAYYHKRNRWERVKAVVDEARAGNFDGLIVSTLLEPASVLRTMVPLLAGSAPVVVYSPTVESLVDLVDMYSTARRTAFINKKRELESQSSGGEAVDLSSLHEEFIVDPTLLLPPTLQTSRVRPWQVLPGRTHPLMTGRGGAEGYLFHGIRVFPTTQNIQAAGNVRNKRRKMDNTSTPVSDRDVEMTS